MDKEELIKNQVTESLRGSQSTDQVVKTKLVYAPPLYLRIIRIFVASLIGSASIGLLTFLYATAYERANYIDVEQYIAEKYEGMKETDPLPPLEERTEIIFPGSSNLSEEGLDDLENFAQIVTVQFVASEITEMRRDGAVLYFTVDRAEYSVELSSPDSYPYLDELIRTGDFNFSRYFEEQPSNSNNEEPENNG